MANNKSLDEFKLIAAVLHDVQTLCSTVFNSRALFLTLQKVRARLAQEGLSFLTKTLPKLGKAFDKALSQSSPLNASELRFEPQSDSELPKFLGELFNEVLDPSGVPLANPNTEYVRIIRQVLYLFYKYELAYTNEQEQQVISRFKKTEDDIAGFTDKIGEIRDGLSVASIQHLDRRRRICFKCDLSNGCRRTTGPDADSLWEQHQDSSRECRRNTRSVYSSGSYDRSTPAVAREAKRLLAELFVSFDPTDIYPRHGPGAVATKQQLWAKYQWTNISARITAKYPIDAYFYASLGHVADELASIQKLTEHDLPARVCLVPKDSRGPRLISCEPVDYQWIQQGLGRAIVKWVESHDLTSHNVFFTNQQPNQFGALLGSSTGRYATLDLNEASDRVSVELVRLLFPAHICEYLEACRSSSTVLPDGEVLKLNKFAPMGSALCFPILALTTWAILTAGAPDVYTQQRILVYGDDVIVPTAYAENAIEQLESFGLKVNRDKSCIKGFFRESCGTDAFKGVNVTPVRLRTVWSSSRSPEAYSSWIAYANSFYSRRMFHTYDYIVGLLVDLYQSIPGPELSHLGVPCLAETPDNKRPIRRRVNRNLQKLEYHVYAVKSPVIRREIDGWSMLLRYFAEKANNSQRLLTDQGEVPIEESSPFSVSSYTRRRASLLARRWR